MLAHLYSHIVYKKEAAVTTDASEKAIGCVLLQGHPVRSVSRNLNQRSKTTQT